MSQNGGEEMPDESVANNQNATVRNQARAPQDASERFHHRSVGVVDARRQLHPALHPNPFREATWTDGRRRKLRAERLMSGQALSALTAGRVVNERNAAAVSRLANDLVPQHDASMCRIELFDIRAAQSAGSHAHHVARAVGVWHLAEHRQASSIDNDRPHWRILGSSRQEALMAVKLHRCSVMWLKINGHPCWRVQSALDEQGVEYEVVKEPWPLRSKRTDVIAATGGSALPAIELEDGTWWRDQSATMANEIRAGKLGTPA